MSDLRIFVWDALTVSQSDYADGNVVVLAETVEDARVILRADREERERVHRAWEAEKDALLARLAAEGMVVWKWFDLVAFRSSESGVPESVVRQSLIREAPELPLGWKVYSDEVQKHPEYRALGAREPRIPGGWSGADSEIDTEPRTVGVDSPGIVAFSAGGFLD